MKFTFAGTDFNGRPGETLAAALVRNGIRGGFRSIDRNRERGVFSAGEEEPNAFVQIEGSPVVPATLVFLTDGLVANPVAGKAQLRASDGGPRYEAMHAHCDVLVVGAGRSGLAAARAAQGRVLLINSGTRTEEVPGLQKTWVVGLYDGNYAIAVERGRVLWRIRAKKIVLATGASELPEIYADNDWPGTMLAGAYESYGRPADAHPTTGGWAPRVDLWSQLRGGLRWDERIGAPVPDDDLPNVKCVGRLTGEGLPAAPAFAIPDGDEDTMFVDLERDQTVADVRRAVNAGLRSMEHVKRYTTIGTGRAQGKTSNIPTLRTVAEILQIPPSELVPTTFRAPYIPLPFAVAAGRSRGGLFDPVRVTPIQRAHLDAHAVFENVGQWKRPRFYPRGGDNMEAAVARECLAARTGVAMMDASTLGKIDVRGPDALAFLNRLYTNGFDTLKVGACRYALMCKADGMVFDDGVVLHVGHNHFLCTTTTGNAGPVFSWMQEWLQTDWAELRVWLTSVTEQWGTIAVVGPKSRQLLQALTPVPLDNDAFPFMAIRDGKVAGIDARICRISFSGELAFEINVDARRALELWSAIAAAGDVSPYGTEALHVLRAEKGYVIVGQDTDGTVTPDDLGMSWIVSKTKGFIGKRSLTRTDLTRADRKQLVGLLSVDQQEVLPEGAQLISDPSSTSMIGHVTSSYYSQTLGQPIALALVKRGRERIGRTIHAFSEDRLTPAQIVSPVFYDKEGKRRDGPAT